MEQNKVEMYLSSNKDYFPTEKILILREKLLAMDENKFAQLSAMKLKYPNAIVIASVFVGGLGIDRFMLGDMKMGLIKLFTCGGLGVLTIFDWCTIWKKTKVVNFDSIMAM